MNFKEIKRHYSQPASDALVHQGYDKTFEITATTSSSKLFRSRSNLLWPAVIADVEIYEKYKYRFRAKRNSNRGVMP